MFRFFERRLSPFPDSPLDVPPQGFWPFVWYYVRDAVPWLAGTAFLTAIIAVGEVTLFGFLGGIVDWLSSADRDGFLQREGTRLALMAGVVLVALPLATLIHALIVYQGLMGNVPMSARWRMHRQMLGQSMNFFGNEFAGVTPKALARQSNGHGHMTALKLAAFRAALPPTMNEKSGLS